MMSQPPPPTVEEGLSSMEFEYGTMEWNGIVKRWNSELPADDPVPSLLIAHALFVWPTRDLDLCPTIIHASLHDIQTWMLLVW